MKKNRDFQITFCLALFFGAAFLVAMFNIAHLNSKLKYNPDKEMAEKFSDVIRNAYDNGDTAVWEMAVHYQVDDDLAKYSWCY